MFGTVFPFYIDGWEQEAAAGRPFSTLQVDDFGYPIHGHLTWADARWWAAAFERHGFRREAAIERALHQKYDRHMKAHSPARCAYFVFSKGATDDRREAVGRAIANPTSLITNP